MRIHLPPTYPSHLHPSLPDGFGLRVFWPPRPGTNASYALRVPRAGSLRTASFRPHLTVTALAVRLMVPAIRVHRGLAPPSECALPGAPKKKGRVKWPCLFSQKRLLLLDPSSDCRKPDKARAEKQKTGRQGYTCPGLENPELKVRFRVRRRVREICTSPRIRVVLPL